MERREALRNMGLVMGATLISSELFISCKSDASAAAVSAASGGLNLNEHKDTIMAIADVILPSTKLSGIKSLRSDNTMLAILNDCYTEEQKSKIKAGLDDLVKSQVGFATMSLEDRTKIIAEVDKAYFDPTVKKEDKPTYYGAIKETTLLTYFTDKKVMTDVLSYVKVPGKYDGAYKLTPGKTEEIYGFGA
jgi:hypothetical protein